MIENPKGHEGVQKKQSFVKIKALSKKVKSAENARVASK